MRRRGLAIPLLSLAVAACGGDDAQSVADAVAAFLPPSQLPPVSLPSPFAPGCDVIASGGAASYVNAEVEPSFAINPLNPDNVIGVWQQDRWSNGGAHGVVSAASLDGGTSWAIGQATFSRCSGGSAGDGGDYARATDPWVSFGPDGIAYWMALAFFVPDVPNAMRVARSTDGGLSWDTPVSLIVDTGGEFNDKNAVTADPFTAGYAYAVWDRLDNNDRGPAWFSRTTDGGVSWETSRILYDPGVGAQTIGNQVVVLPDGTLVNLLTEITASNTAVLEVVRSTDQGVNWSVPTQVAQLLAIGAVDPQSGTPIRDGGILAEITVGPTGTLYVGWQDSRFSGGARDGIALSMSVDGGLSWTTPVQVNRVPGTQAFTPALAVAPDGTLGVTYFDFRDNTGADSLPTGYFLATTTDGVSWTERRVAADFDITSAPFAGGWFLGDYQGLKADDNGFALFFVTTNRGSVNRTDVRFTRLPAAVPAPVAKALGVYPAGEAPAVRMTPEWSARLADKVERSRHHFPDRDIPRYLRR